MWKHKLLILLVCAVTVLARGRGGKGPPQGRDIPRQPGGNQRPSQLGIERRLPGQPEDAERNRPGGREVGEILANIKLRQADNEERRNQQPRRPEAENRRRPSRPEAENVQRPSRPDNDERQRRLGNQGRPEIDSSQRRIGNQRPSRPMPNEGNKRPRNERPRKPDGADRLGRPESGSKNRQEKQSRGGIFEKMFRRHHHHRRHCENSTDCARCPAEIEAGITYECDNNKCEKPVFPECNDAGTCESELLRCVEGRNKTKICVPKFVWPGKNCTEASDCEEICPSPAGIVFTCTENKCEPPSCSEQQPCPDQTKQLCLGGKCRPRRRPEDEESDVPVAPAQPAIQIMPEVL